MSFCTNTYRIWFSVVTEIPTFPCHSHHNVGRDSSVRTATRYRLDDQGIESQWGGIFGICPDRPWCLPRRLYIGYQVLQGVNAVGGWRWPPTLSLAEVRERVELYLYSHSGTSCLLHGELYLASHHASILPHSADVTSCSLIGRCQPLEVIFFPHF